ncbi:hypothetical protein [Nocardia rhizosphaerae]|uniref:Uncharacterized protein n=1 Tax=Nocardia rhizosphaerae TaxID=1691571 RepID=A0ABV8L2G6_9NOCA
MGAIVTGGRGLPFFPSGMTKNGNSSALPNTFTKVTAWTADTGTYPGSSVVSDNLVVQGPKSGATISASIVIANSSSAQNAQIQLKIGSTIIATSTATSVPTFGSATLTCSGPADVALGDQITLEAKSTSGFNLTVSGGVNTWVRCT